MLHDVLVFHYWIWTRAAGWPLHKNPKFTEGLVLEPDNEIWMISKHLASTRNGLVDFMNVERTQT